MRGPIQFQNGLSLFEFQGLYGTEELCEGAPEKAHWPACFRCPRCNCDEHGFTYGQGLKHYECRSCGHQATTLMSRTIMQQATYL